MKKYKSMKTSKLLDLLPDAPDDEINDIMEEVRPRLGLDYFDGLIDELEDRIKTLESEFKRHIHSGNKVYIESK